MTFTVLAPIIAACISALVGIGTAFYHVFTARTDAENTPEMKANAQAKTDEALMEEAEQAVTEADQGRPQKEQRGDAR